MGGNAYITLDALKGTGLLNVSGTAYDARLLQLSEDVSRALDRWCNRRFFYWIETVTLNGPGGTLFLLPQDLVSIPASGITEDENGDGTFENVWSATDFLYHPQNANPTAAWGGTPYRGLRVNPASNGTQDEFIAGVGNYQLAGTWGYWKVTTASGELLSASVGTTATLLVSSVSPSTIGVGQTVLLDSEQMYVRAVATNTLTIDRAVNGSTAATHTATATISLVTYPGPIIEAAAITAARLWKRKDAAFASQVGMPETGLLTVWRGGLDPDVKEMLGPLRRLTAL